MKTTQKYTISIFDEPISLISDESAEHVSQAAVLIDVKMREIAQGGSIKDHKRIALLAALCVASDMLKLQNNLTHRMSKEADLVSRLERFLEPVNKM